MHILVTGENSYAGRQFEKRIQELNLNWKIEFVSVRNNEWQKKDFSVYDAIYHVAAIVHQKERRENELLYYKINRDLSYKLAKKAKLEGVKSFVFLSTMAVYGLIGKIGEDTIIYKSTQEKPISYYGKSKLEAEYKINNLQSNEFQVLIIRIPMIYGYACPGNYSALSQLVKKIPVFPKINNRRSMIHINLLSDIVVHLLKTQASGMFLVKNREDINTLAMVNEIAKNNKKRIYNSFLLGLLVKNFGNHFNVTKKMFSNVYYASNDCIVNGFEYREISFEESISISEGINYVGNESFSD